ncbi:MAG: hypothetical protein DPW09_30645 [Anaerolineae bacterium]|nr:hypothetical protein [Anaerolineales bacterium]MCQ3977808.1 hypothetical protein [Anaerolineae bacterium]
MKEIIKIPAFMHTVDAYDVLTDVNDHWLRFAQENDASHLTRQVVVGRPLWDFIAGREAPHLYKLLMRQVRQSQCRLVFTYRCDSPNFRRYMQMEIVPLTHQGLEFRNYLLRTESRDQVRLLDSAIGRNQELLMMCSWCNRVHYDSTWLSVEDAVKTLGLFALSELPQITHGICPDCALSFKNLT